MPYNVHFERSNAYSMWARYLATEPCWDYARYTRGRWHFCGAF